MKKITVTWGLPGSGKTTFCTNAKPYRYDDSFSMLCHDDPYYKNNNDKFIREINSRCEYGKFNFYVDTLVTTNEGFVNLFKNIKVGNLQELEIRYFIPNIETCLWNDRYRRPVSSEITIKNMVVEQPNISKIKELCPKLKDIKMTVVSQESVRKENWVMFADKYKIQHTDGIVKSYSWSLGGTYGNCWNDSIGTVSPGEPLSDFENFDEILLEICPNLGVLQYKKIRNKCVSIMTKIEGDYYGGSTTDAWYQFNVQTLYNELYEMDLITNEQL